MISFATFAGSISMSDFDKWYPFYPGDYQKDTMLLSDNADLIYRRMLDFYWINGGKFDEKTLKKLPKILRVSREKFASNWPKIREFFPLIDGYYTNPRMEDEILKAAQKVASASENGKKGGRPKKKLQLLSSLSETKAQKGDGDGPIHGSDNNTNTLGEVIYPETVNWD